MKRIWQNHYPNHEEAIVDVSHYITVFYNQVRLYLKLEYLSPNSFEQKTSIFQ